MSDRTWHKGWPPFTGWWNMNSVWDRDTWRWVDVENKFISMPVYQNDRLIVAEELARIEDGLSINKFEYTFYWPENARVPRIDPRGNK